MRRIWPVLIFMILMPFCAYSAEPLNPGALGGMSMTELPYSEVVKKARNGEIDEILVRAGYGFPGLYIRAKDGTMWHSFMPTQRLDERILETGVTVRADNGSSVQKASDWAASALWIIMMLATIMMVYFLIRQQARGGAISKIEKSSKIKGLKFSDVAGQAEAKRELQEIVDILKSPLRFSEAGARIPRGVLLEGEPGNGKTMLARAVAGECGVNFFHLDASGLVEMFAGLGPRRVRAAFKACKKAAPCILFIDEIDSAGKKRGNGAMGAQNEYDSIVNQFLTEMDGINTTPGKEVIVIAATNRADMLDPALTRPGRLDRRIFVPRPSLSERKELLEIEIRNRKIRLESSVNLGEVGKTLTGCSNAEVTNIVNEAVINSIRNNRNAVTLKDFTEARDRFLVGLLRPAHIMSEKERKISAYHEAGHALMSVSDGDSDPIHSISIVPRGQSLGSVISIPERDDLIVSKERLVGRIHILMGGRAAEETVFGGARITTGARQDFRQATMLMMEMIGRFGMGKHIGFHANRDEDGLSSESQKAMMEQEVQDMLGECMKHALYVMKSGRNVLDKIVERLLAEESMTGEEVTMLIKQEQATLKICNESETENVDTMD